MEFPEGTDHLKTENISGLFVADGSFLRRKGVVVYDSLSKVFMNASYSPGKLAVTLQRHRTSMSHFCLETERRK